MKEYVGIFAALISDFVAFKRSLGFSYQTEADELYRFSCFTTSFPVAEPILSQEIVQAWNVQRPHEGVTNNVRRVCVVRQFAMYLNSKGYKAYIAPPNSRTRHYTFVPYIFTQNEIERIFAASDRLFPHRRSTMSIVLPVILRLLYSCGLRISEAVALQNKHVDLQKGLLEIKNSKFGKDRLIPMSESMLHCCRQYDRQVHQQSSDEHYFFMDVNHQPITRDNVYRRFREVLWKSGISHGGKGQGPRLHDVRHTYAVHSLKHAVDRNIDVYCALPILSTYMGHASIEATSQYVRLTAEAFPEICDTLDRTCSHVIPEVAWE